MQSECLRLGMPAHRPFAAACHCIAFSALSSACDATRCAGSHIVTHLKLVEKVRPFCGAACLHPMVLALRCVVPRRTSSLSSTLVCALLNSLSLSGSLSSACTLHERLGRLGHKQRGLAAALRARRRLSRRPLPAQLPGGPGVLCGPRVDAAVQVRLRSHSALCIGSAHCKRL